MDGFKNSTRTQYMKGGACEGYAKGGKVRGAAKINKVMSEFKAGTLHSGSKKGPEVTSKKQAVAIALSEARKAGAKIPQPVQKKGIGGILKAVSPVAALASGEPEKLMGGMTGMGIIAQLLKKKQSGTITPAENQQLIAAQAQQGAMKKGGKVVKRNKGTPMGKGPERASAEADDVLMARMSKDELALGAKGLKMARERMARERAAGSDRETRVTQREVVKPARKGVPVAPREAMIGGREAADTYMARLPRGAVKPAQPGIPSYTPGTRSGLNKGGLAAMPRSKGKKC